MLFHKKDIYWTRKYAFSFSDLKLANMTFGLNHCTPSGHRQPLWEEFSIFFYKIDKTGHDCTDRQTDGQSDSYIPQTWFTGHKHKIYHNIILPVKFPSWSFLHWSWHWLGGVGLWHKYIEQYRQTLSSEQYCNGPSQETSPHWKLYFMSIKSHTVLIIKYWWA